MQQIKRPPSDSFNNDNNKKTKIQVTTSETNYFSTETVTTFEQLPDKVIDEIFEYLDYFYIYKTFNNVNRRFHNLLTAPTRSIKINLSSISKSTFAQYYKTIITHNEDKINSLRISNIFIYDDRDIPLIGTISQFTRLETLILDNIEEKHLENILRDLVSLPYLSSLIINTVNNVEDKNSIYHQIVLLPVLKYCKLSIGDWITTSQLPLATTEYSTIEQLILHNEIYLDQLRHFLSYLPQLRYLSFHSLRKSSDSSTKIRLIPLFYLIHLSLKIVDISFDQFEQMIKNICAPIEVLRITADGEYMNAEKWEKLILSHIPNLRIFDVRLDIVISAVLNQMMTDYQTDQFRSTFWRERGWFFQYISYPLGSENHGTFYSTNPYRRMDFTLHTESKAKICSTRYDRHLKSVDHLRIQSEESIISSVHYFPNATKLTLDANVPIARIAIASILNRVICLKHITKLIIDYKRLFFVKLMDLLSFLPNVHTLKCKSMNLYQQDVISLQESKIFRTISKRNRIKNVSFDDMCSLDKVKLLVALCPRLQNLTMDIIKKDMEEILQYLLERTNPHTGRLVSLCFLKAGLYIFNNLNALVESEKLPRRCVLKYVDSNLYLWW